MICAFQIWFITFINLPEALNKLPLQLKESYAVIVGSF